MALITDMLSELCSCQALMSFFPKVGLYMTENSNTNNVVPTPKMMLFFSLYTVCGMRSLFIMIFSTVDDIKLSGYLFFILNRSPHRSKSLVSFNPTPCLKGMSIRV